MIETILIAAVMISVAIVLSIPRQYDYHMELHNIAYQLSRIADALNRKEDGEQDG